MMVRPATVAAVLHNRGFSTARMVQQASPVDKKLSTCLKKERSEEQDVTSDVVVNYLKNAPFKLHDNPDEMEVMLKRQMGDEGVSIVFEYEKDLSDALNFDEDEENEEGNEQDEEERVPHLPFLVQVTKAKNGIDNGTLTFECLADSGQVIINNVVFTPDSKVAKGDDVESDWKRGLVYPGPDFLSLDSTVQEIFYEYLEERGINSDLAEFLPEYVNMKENKSYLRWLEQISKFLEQ